MATTDKKAPTAPKRSIPVVGIVFGAIAVILVLAIVLTGGDSDAPDEYGNPSVEGASLSAYPAGLRSIADDPAIGEGIPTLTGTDFDGSTVEISADGVAKGIVFLAHWCPHCQAEVPRVTEWLAQTGGVEGVDIVSVASSIDPIRDNYPSSEWLQGEGWPVDVILDDQNSTAYRAFGAGGFPYWVFVNSEGNVIARTAGELDIDTLSGFLALARDS